MQGSQITAYTGSPHDENGFSPALADNIIKSWAPSRKKAESEKRRMEREHGGRVMIR